MYGLYRFFMADRLFFQDLFTDNTKMPKKIGSGLPQKNIIQIPGLSRTFQDTFQNPGLSRTYGNPVVAGAAIMMNESD